jgi:hypothetical protein
MSLEQFLDFFGEEARSHVIGWGVHQGAGKILGGT